MLPWKNYILILHFIDENTESQTCSTVRGHVLHPYAQHPGSRQSTVQYSSASLASSHAVFMGITSRRQTARSESLACFLAHCTKQETLGWPTRNVNSMSTSEVRKWSPSTHPCHFIKQPKLLVFDGRTATVAFPSWSVHYNTVTWKWEVYFILQFHICQSTTCPFCLWEL